MLDLVITDIECEVSRDLLPLVKKDAHHPSLSLLCNIKVDHERPFTVSEINTAYNFKRANFVGLYNALTYIDWSFLNVSKDVNDMCDSFYNKLYRLLDLYVPRYIKKNHKYPVWYSREIIRDIKTKNNLRRGFKRNRSPGVFEEFSRVRKLVKQQISDSYKLYLQNVQNDIISNSNRFWSFIHSKSNRSRIPGKMTFEDKILTIPPNNCKRFCGLFPERLYQRSVSTIGFYGFWLIVR
nr:unnamed protein product [Callosobruchus analis]